MTYKPVQGGRFKVNRKGDVKRRKYNGSYEDAPVFIINARYKGVSYSRNSVQEHYYIHRLVAEAFVDNPEGKEQVYIIDNDRDNIVADNLMWVTAKERYAFAKEDGHIKTRANSGKKCATCDNLVLSAYQCNDCYRENTVIANKLTKRYKLKKEWAHYYNKADAYKPIYKRAVVHRYSGKTLDEIGEIEGVSREAIRRRLLNIVAENSRVYI